MRVNTPQSRQAKKSRYFHVLVVLFLVPWIAGCGGSEDAGSEDAGTENGIPESSLSADQDKSPQNLSITGDGSSGDVSDDAAANPTAENPPGTLKLPSDLEKASSDGEGGVRMLTVASSFPQIWEPLQLVRLISTVKFAGRKSINSPSRLVASR